MARTRETAGAKDKGKAVASEQVTTDKGKKRARVDGSRPRKSNADPLRSSLASATIQPTRFVDWDTMARLGVREDMEAMFVNLGLRHYMHLKEFTHGPETIDFLGSLTVAQDAAETLYAGILFTVHGQTYTLTAEDLCNIYGFQRVAMTEDALSYHGGMFDLWHKVAAAQYRPGKVKASHIRNPAIKLVQKALGFTFFGRYLVGPLTKEEWRMICYALKPFTTDMEPPVRSVADVDSLTVFIANLLVIQDVARSKKATSWPLCIGGALTPIFRHCGIELTPPVGPIPLIDIEHLSKSRFLTRAHQGILTYPYSWGLHSAEIVLPAPDLVSLLNPANIIFKHLLDGRTTPQPDPAVAHDESAEEDIEPEEATEAEASTSAPTYGARRYHSGPLTATPRTPVERQLAKQNSMLQRWVKWQGRTMQKMANTIKSLKRRMRSIEKHTGHVSRTYLEEGRTKARHDHTSSPQSSNPSLELDTPPGSDSESETS